MESIYEYIASGAAFLLAFSATAFGYGKLNQKVDGIVASHEKDIITIQSNFDKFIETNITEHQVIFDEFRTFIKHMGAVEKYMEMEEKRKNGRSD